MQDLDSVNTLTPNEKTWWQKNITPLIAGVLVILTLLVLSMSWKIREEIRNQEAQLALNQTVTWEQQKQTAEKFLGTDAAAIALLLIASQQHDQKDYVGAIETYALFQQHYPRHPMYHGALLGTAYAFLAQKNLEQAQLFFQKMLQEPPSDSYTPLAQLQLALLLQEQGHKIQAQEALEDLARHFASSIYGKQAVVLLSQWEKPSPSTQDGSLTKE